MSIKRCDWQLRWKVHRRVSVLKSRCHWKHAKMCCGCRLLRSELSRTERLWWCKRQMESVWRTCKLGWKRMSVLRLSAELKKGKSSLAPKNFIVCKQVVKAYRVSQHEIV